MTGSRLIVLERSEKTLSPKHSFVTNVHAAHPPSKKARLETEAGPSSPFETFVRAAS